MFDTLPSVPRDTALDAAQCGYFDHGHRLAEAARLIGDPSAEAHVIDLGVRLTHAARMTDHIRRDLVVLHRLLSLDEVPEVDPAEIIFVSRINPASPLLEEICLQTDLLEDLLTTVAHPPILLPLSSPP